MSTHLVIGASGQVGGALLRAIGPAGQGTCRTQAVPGLRELDIRNAAEVGSLVSKLHPATIWLCAAMGNADWCERHPEEAYATNVVGAQNAVRAANEVRAKLVYFSTDYIFDGKSGPYREDDLPNPICVYGRQKLLAEHCIALHARDHLIVRTTVVYGWEIQRKNFVCRLLDTLGAGHGMRVPSDQIGSPTYAPHLAEAVRELVARSAHGVYHVVGADRISRSEFAHEAARVFGLDEGLIEPVLTRELDQPAPRPLNAGMCSAKTDPLPGWRAGLQAMKEASR